MTFNPPVKCPTCGKDMHVVCVGKINPVYVLTCENPTVKHPIRVIGPSAMFEPVAESQ